MSPYQNENGSDRPILGVDSDRPLPHSRGAEQGVLSCALQWPVPCCDDALDRLPNAAFYVPQHQRIFKSLRVLSMNMSTKELDMLAVLDYLEQRNWLEQVGGEMALREIYNAVPTQASSDRYLQDVADAYARRMLIQSARESIADLMDNENLDECFKNAENRLVSAINVRTGQSTVTMSDACQAARDELVQAAESKEGIVGLPTGFFRLDQVLRGLRAQRVYVLAARPSLGKSALGLNIAQNLAKEGHAVGIFSLEMSCTELAKRAICSEIRKNPHAVKRADINTIEYGQQRTGSLPIFLDDSTSLSITKFKQRARKMVYENNCEIVVADYLQLMKGDQSGGRYSREREVASISAGAKELARELNIPVLMIAQLSRAAEGAHPTLAHLRESGAIEQDADVVAFLHRERDNHDPEVMRRIRAGEGIETMVIIAKHRGGPVGVRKLLFFPQYTLFTDAKQVKDEDIPKEDF